MRNPKWTRDELILTLDLYYDAGQLSPTDSRVIELSELLNRLPIHTTRPDEEKFRNANGVALKLANYRSLDPNDPAQGMSRGGKTDKYIWDEFVDNKLRLREISEAIYNAAMDTGSIPTIPEPDENEIEVEEGRILYRLHRTRERDSKIVREKKKDVLRKKGELVCEICTFNFKTTYGKLGTEFIECHHINHICKVEREKTKLDDLVLVCANCHRMLHRGKQWKTIAELKKIIL